MRCFLLAFALFLHTAGFTDETPSKETASAKVAAFTPPPGWKMADPSSLPTHVKIMVVGEGAKELPPSINLGYEPFQGSLKEYLKIVKRINMRTGDEWKDLGTIQTQAGPASLSQVDMKSKWGNLRQMHVIYLADGIVYILTAAALKEEFPRFYPQFFEAFHTFRVENAPSPQETASKL
jgi:hypothetical protein